jgi:hypothetical protein
MPPSPASTPPLRAPARGERGRRAFLSLSLALALLATSARSALAEVNQAAPKLEAKEWVGPPLDWSKERGKVVVLLFVQPRQPASDAALKDQADLMKQRGKDGLETLLVSDGRKSEVDLWSRSAARAGSWRIAIEEGGKISVQFMAQVTPFIVVVDRDGRDVFEGEAVRDRVLAAKAVADALDRPVTVRRDGMSARLKPAWAAIDAKDWKTAVKAAVEVRDDPASTAEEARDARSVLVLLAGHARKAQKDAQALLEGEDYYEAVLAFEAGAASFAGTAPADEMKKSADAIRKDKKLKTELSAGEEVHKALTASDPAGKLKAVIANSRYKGTRAVERAKQRLDELKRK